MTCLYINNYDSSQLTHKNIIRLSNGTFIFKRRYIPGALQVHSTPHVSLSDLWKGRQSSEIKDLG